MGLIPETPHFGFTRVGPGEALSKNGYANQDADKLKLDDLIYALFTHSHNGDPALGGPSSAPTLVADATGGNIPASTTLYYRVSFVDQYNLETDASDEASITTRSIINAPNAPALSLNTAGGSLVAGTYSYVITFVDAAGGETTTSPLNSYAVPSGSANRVRLDLPSLPTHAVKWNVYRSRPGQTNLYKLASPTATPYYDAGSSEDQTIIAPTINTTNAQNSIEVTIPGGIIPEGCASWRIYRASTSGGYSGQSLVHQVVEGSSDTDPTPVTMWVDTGDTLLTGFPQNTSSTAPQGRVLDLGDIDGALPMSALPRGGRLLNSFTPGVLTNGQVLNVTESPGPLSPVRLTAFFQTPPTAGGVVTSVVVSDGTNSVTLQCSPSTHQVGDAAGYWHTEYPLLTDASFQAEDGTLSSGVLIDNDVAASSQQAVTLDSNSDYVQVDLGELDPGVYHTFATLRVLGFDTVTTGNDIEIKVIRTDTNATVGTHVLHDIESSAPLDPDSVPADFQYIEYSGPTITAPGGVDLALRVSKVTASTQSYDIDTMRYYADVPVLSSGTITTTATVAGGVNNGADVNVAIWF